MPDPTPSAVLPGTPNPEPGGTAVRFVFDREDALKALAAETVQKSVERLSSLLKAALAAGAVGVSALGLQGALQLQSYRAKLTEYDTRAAELRARADQLQARTDSLQGKADHLAALVDSAKASAKDIAQTSITQRTALNDALTKQTEAFVLAVGVYGRTSEQAARAADDARTSAQDATAAVSRLAAVRDSARDVVKSAQQFRARYDETANLVDRQLRNTWTAVVPEDSTTWSRIPGSDFQMQVLHVTRSHGITLRIAHVTPNGFELACDGRIVATVIDRLEKCDWQGEQYTVVVKWAIKQHQSILHRGRFKDLVGLEWRLSEPTTRSAAASGSSGG